MIMSNYKSILIISFYFPPYPKVGGRRWAKFAKYLNRMGIDSHVLCLTMNQDKKSPWDKDVIDYKDKVHRIKKKYLPPYFRRSVDNKSLIHKIRWIISYNVNKLLKTKGIGKFDDSSEKYKKEFFNRSKELIDQYDFQTIIVTVGPFRYGHELRKLKKKYPQKQFILDVRDFWEDWMFNYTDKQRIFERKIEEQTFKEFDLIFSCSKRICEHYKKKYQNQENKFKHLTHGYDKEDYNFIEKVEDKFNKKRDLKIAYTGSLYPDMEKYLDRLFKFLLSMKKYYKRIVLDLYCLDKGYEKYLEKSGDKIEVNFKIPLTITKLSIKLKNEYDYMLYMRSDKTHDKHIFSTKFFDYLGIGKRILFVGESGDVSDFIISNNIGLFLDEDNLDEIKKEIIGRNHNKYKSKFNKKKYEYSAITETLISYLN